jgi:hypothetical protein
MSTTCPYPEPARSSPYPTLHLPKIHPYIILPSTPGSPKWSPSFRFPYPVYASPLPHMRYMPFPSHFSLFFVRTILVNLRYSRINSTKFPGSGAGNVSEPSHVAEVGSWGFSGLSWNLVCKMTGTLWMLILVLMSDFPSVGHEGIWGGGGTASLILSLDNNRKWLVSFTLRSPNPPEQSSR